VDTTLNENEVELGVLVLSVLLEVLTHGDSLLDDVVEILGHVGSETTELQDTQDLVASDTLDLGYTHTVSKSHTNLRGSHTLLSELADLLEEILRLHLNPSRRLTLIR